MVKKKKKQMARRKKSNLKAASHAGADTRSNRKNANALRIIGGDWRSRKIPFIDAQGLRPTPDRIRETLFNWLQGDVYGASCLDLFAGSGALGIEALSRGADDVVFVEKNQSVANQLTDNLKTLNSDSEVLQGDALKLLSGESLGFKKPFDIVFLDPPYRKGLLEDSLQSLFENELLEKNGLIYLEHEAEQSFDWGTYHLEVLKQTVSGQVCSYLLKGSKKA